MVLHYLQVTSRALLDDPMVITTVTSLVIASACCLLVFVFQLAMSRTRRLSKNTNNIKYGSGDDKIKRVVLLPPPQPSGSWPLIGHLHLLAGSELPHKVLSILADKYGPIFQIKVGVHRALVVSSPEMAKECLSTNDRAFASRPRTRAFELLGYNCAMVGLAPYGPYWREVRKISTIELLSNHRIGMLKHIRISEVRNSIKEIYDRLLLSYSSSSTTTPSHDHIHIQSPSTSTTIGSRAVVLMDMKQWFADVTLNAMTRLVVGKSLRDFPTKEEQDRCHRALRAFFDLTGVSTPSDALPYLRWFDIGGYEKTMKGVAKELDFFTQQWLEAHKRDLASGQVKEKRDFMDVMLDVFDASISSSNKATTSFQYDTDTIIKATCQAMILAGADTSTVTLIWALSLLLNHPRSLTKAQEELDAHVGRERLVDESDIKNLVYLQAIIKETIRLYPAAPLSVPRESIDDVTINGYHIPAKTRLFVNIHKIHRDPQIWGPNSCEFYPERFLTTHKELDVRGHNFEFIPFGSGRRICPGISYAVQSLPFTLANLLHGFNLSTHQPIDMEERLGLTSIKVSPLDVFVTPRLPRQLYENIIS